MTELTHGEVKGQFHHLVQAVGGTMAAAAFLGVSHQRVSAMQSIQHPDAMPSIMQVFALEQALGKSILFSALADRISGVSRRNDPLKEAGDVMVAGAEVFDAIRTGKDRRAIAGAVAKLEREVADVGQALIATDETS